MRAIVLLALVGALTAGCQLERVKPPDGWCPPLTCDEVGASCGLVNDGCGGLMDCGGCAAGEVCGSAGFESVCCEPIPCEAQGASCGEVSDGCGGTALCGSCPDGLTCGGAGPNRCGQDACTPASCAALGLTCGTVSDGCGATLDCGVCGGDETCGGDGRPNVCAVPSVAPPTEGLADGCFGWPAAPFTDTNYARVSIALEAGEIAPDFTLLDLEGNPHRLYELLETGPVMLETGSYTCPIFQRNIAETELMAAIYAGDVHFVVVYTPEAHPQGDISPYSGRVNEREYSVYSQADSYDERVERAAAVVMDDVLLMLVDDLAPRTADNPVWCTYGTAPNAAWLIDTSGEVAAAHRWFDAPSMTAAIDDLLGR